MSGQYPYYYPTPAGSSRFPSSRPTQAPDNDSGYNTAPESRRSTFSSDSHRTVASSWNTYPPSSLTVYGGVRGACNASNYYNSSRYETPLYQPTPWHAPPNLMGPPPTFRASPAPQRYNESRASSQQSFHSPSGYASQSPTMSRGSSHSDLRASFPSQSSLSSLAYTDPHRSRPSSTRPASEASSRANDGCRSGNSSRASSRPDSKRECENQRTSNYAMNQSRSHNTERAYGRQASGSYSGHSSSSRGHHDGYETDLDRAYDRPYGRENGRCYHAENEW